MNKAMIVGRLTRDPNVRYSQGENQTCVARFTLVVDRRRSKNSREGAKTADFISCVAFGKTGEFVEKYARKGMKFDIVGRIQTGSYQDKDGKTVYTTDIVVEEIEFGESKASAQANGAAPANGGNANAETAGDDGFMKVPDEIDDELPFN